MSVQLYLCAGSIAAVWVVWGAMTARARESKRLAREFDQRLRMSVELLDTLPGALRR